MFNTNWYQVAALTVVALALGGCGTSTEEESNKAEGATTTNPRPAIPFDWSAPIPAAANAGDVPLVVTVEKDIEITTYDGNSVQYHNGKALAPEAERTLSMVWCSLTNSSSPTIVRRGGPYNVVGVDSAALDYEDARRATLHVSQSRTRFDIECFGLDSTKVMTYAEMRDALRGMVQFAVSDEKK